MVYILDEGSVFDAPLDKIWKYLSSQDHNHKSIKSLNREVSGNAVTLTREQNVLGKTVTVKVKNTLYPPIGFIQEYLEGPLKGSKAFLYYIPKGEKTGVTIVGDFVMNDADEQTIRNVVALQGNTFFEEDNAKLRQM